MFDASLKLAECLESRVLLSLRSHAEVGKRESRSTFLARLFPSNLIVPATLCGSPAMSSSDIEGASTRDRLLPFDQLNTSSFTSTSLLRGKIETCTSYRDNSASLKLSDKTGSISVQLRGEWAEEAIKSLNRIGKWVTLEAVAGGKDGVRLESIKDKKGKHVVGSDGRKMYKVVYEMGIQGKWGEDGKGPSFAFESELLPCSAPLRRRTGQLTPDAAN